MDLQSRLAYRRVDIHGQAPGQPYSPHENISQPEAATQLQLNSSHQSEYRSIDLLIVSLHWSTRQAVQTPGSLSSYFVYRVHTAYLIGNHISSELNWNLKDIWKSYILNSDLNQWIYCGPLSFQFSTVSWPKERLGSSTYETGWIEKMQTEDFINSRATESSLQCSSTLVGCWFCLYLLLSSASDQCSPQALPRLLVGCIVSHWLLMNRFGWMKMEWFYSINWK